MAFADHSLSEPRHFCNGRLFKHTPSKSKSLYGPLVLEGSHVSGRSDGCRKPILYLWVAFRVVLAMYETLKNQRPLALRRLDTTKAEEAVAFVLIRLFSYGVWPAAALKSYSLAPTVCRSIVPASKGTPYPLHDPPPPPSQESRHHSHG